MDESLSAQIVSLKGTISRMQQTISQLESRLSQAKEDALCYSRRSRNRSGEDDEAGRGCDLVLDKFFEPPPFMKSSGAWREWAEDFVDFIAMSDEELPEALNTAKDTIAPIISLGDNPAISARPRSSIA